MAETFTELKIASGHDNTAGFNFIETLEDTNGQAFGIPEAVGEFSTGTRVRFGNKLVGTQGDQSTNWRFQGGITYEQYQKLIDDYTTESDISGLVTIRTPKNKPDDYANYNAIMTIPSPNQLTPTGRVYNGDGDAFIISFTDLEDIT